MNLALEFSLDALFPGYGNPFLRMLAEVDHVAALVAVHHNAATGAQIAHDLVAGNGVTALCIADDHALCAGNDQLG